LCSFGFDLVALGRHGHFPEKRSGQRSLEPWPLLGSSLRDSGLRSSTKQQAPMERSQCSNTYYRRVLCFCTLGAVSPILLQSARDRRVLSIRSLFMCQMFETTVVMPCPNAVSDSSMGTCRWVRPLPKTTVVSFWAKNLDGSDGHVLGFIVTRVPHTDPELNLGFAIVVTETGWPMSEVLGISSHDCPL
jgi:hypothetical protein